MGAASARAFRSALVITAAEGLPPLISATSWTSRRLLPHRDIAILPRCSRNGTHAIASILFADSALAPSLLVKTIFYDYRLIVPAAAQVGNALPASFEEAHVLGLGEIWRNSQGLSLLLFGDRYALRLGRGAWDRLRRWRGHRLRRKRRRSWHGRRRGLALNGWRALRAQGRVLFVDREQVPLEKRMLLLQFGKLAASAQKRRRDARLAPESPVQHQRQEREQQADGQWQQPTGMKRPTRVRNQTAVGVINLRHGHFGKPSANRRTCSSSRTSSVPFPSAKCVVSRAIPSPPPLSFNRGQVPDDRQLS